MRSWTCDRAHCAFISENEITEKVLPNLTAEDLKELGVNALGHRRTLLDAIAALRVDTRAKAPPTEAPSTLPKSTLRNGRLSCAGAPRAK
jgi:hypothetical protein